MEGKKVLIIDDDTDICMLLKRYLESKSFEVETAFSGSKGISILKNSSFDVVLCDFRLPDHTGVDLIKTIKSINHLTQIIIITGYSDVKQAIKAIKMGAFEYVTKPIQPEEIVSTINEAIKTNTREPQVESVKPSKKTKKADCDKLSDPLPKYVIGTSSNSKKLNENISLIAPTNMSVIITGETGTGKEVAARMIHEKSERAKGPFVAVDCGALPKELASSELFGHKKGAFTGAITDKTGSFEVANGGTLFLDEIGNLTYENQVKLLRVIQERCIKKLGDTKDTPIDVRILVATNDDLTQSVADNEFREDLFYRLNEFQIQLDPLRERKADLMNFADHFLEKSNEELNRSVESFSSEVEEKFKEYYWHGNLRELKNVVKRATLLTKGDKIELTALPQEIIHPSFFEEVNASDSGSENITDLKSVAESAERKAILEVLKKTGFNKSKAAEILKVDRKTLYNKINSYGIDI